MISEVDPVRGRGTLRALATSNGVDEKQLKELRDAAKFRAKQRHG